jgi:hypothetical protein
MKRRSNIRPHISGSRLYYDKVKVKNKIVKNGTVISSLNMSEQFVKQFRFSISGV